MAKINIKDLVIVTYSHAVPKPEYAMWITHRLAKLRVFGIGANRIELKENLIDKLQDMINAKD